MLFQGHELKVGQKLWSMIHGRVVVYTLCIDDDYPIIVKDEQNIFRHYALNGKYMKGDASPTLYWDKPVFDLPQPPTKKCQWLFRKKGVHKNWNITQEKYETFADIILIASSAEIKYEDYEFKRVED